MPYSPYEQRIIDRYLKDVDSIRRQSVLTQARDIRRIRRHFRSFHKEALGFLASQDKLRQAIIPQVIGSMGNRIDLLADQVQETIYSGLKAHDEYVRQMMAMYGDQFIQDSLPEFVGGDPRMLDIAASHSAELISLRQGGLGYRMQQQVNRVLKLAALGATGDAIRTAGLINQALGGPLTWSFQAERIYRTEVLRFHSIRTQAGIETLNKRVPTKKKWVWSGIERPEHQAINGQLVAATRSFSVPLPSGGRVQMRYPRDPRAANHPEAVINCGCMVVPVPVPGKVKPVRPGIRPKVTRKVKAKPKLKPGEVPKFRSPAAEMKYWEKHMIDRGWVKNVAKTPPTGKKLDALGPYSKEWYRAKGVRKYGIEGRSPAESAELIRWHVQEWERMLKTFRLFPGSQYTEGSKRALNTFYYAQTKRCGGVCWRDPTYPKTFMSCGRNPNNTGLYAKNYFDNYGKHHVSDGRWHASTTAETASKHTFRHEMAHAIDGRIELTDLRSRLPNLQSTAGKEWNDLLLKYRNGTGTRTQDTKWWVDNISDYGNTNAAEAWAELFALVSDERYVMGTLPADLEAFVFKAGGIIT